MGLSLALGSGGESVRAATLFGIEVAGILVPATATLALQEVWHQVSRALPG